jgi:hypothetical protein
MARVTIFLLGILPFLIKTFKADSMPEATADVFSKATWIQGTLQEVYGNGEETISIQPVAFAMMTFLPSALATNLTANASAHPWQDRWPGAKYSF